MKKDLSIRLLAATLGLGLVPSAAVAQTAAGEDVLFACDFQNAETRAQFVAYDEDGLTPSTTMIQLGFSTDTGWLLTLQDTNTSTNIFAGSTSSYRPAGQANDWLVTVNPISIPGEGYVLSWNSQALDLELRDGIAVYISTTGNTPADFTGQPVFAIDEEESGPTGNTDGEWTTHRLPLDDYAGQSIYVAFVNNSYDKNILCLDDVFVMTRQYLTLESGLPVYTTEPTIEVKATVEAIDETIGTFQAYYVAADGTRYEQEFASMDIAPGESREITFDQPLTLTALGNYQPVQIGVTYGETTTQITDSVALIPFEPMHKVVIEEGTGQWCGWCPLGIIVLDYLKEKYPDNVVPIAVHNQDAMAIAEYDGNMGFNAFPTGRVNRNRATVTPTTDSYELEGPGSFHDAFVAELALLPEAEVRITSIGMDADSVAHVSTDTRFVLNAPGKTYHIAYAVTSSNYTAPGVQSNYLATGDYPTFGDFGKGGIYGQQYVYNLAYDDVACGIFPSFNGNELTANATLDETYGHEIEIDLKACPNIASGVRIAVAALLIDATDGTIVNADILNLDGSPLGIDSTMPATEAQVRYDGHSLLLPEGCSDVRVYSLSGVLVFAQDVAGARTVSLDRFPQGVYLYMVNTPEGIATGKLAK